MMLTAAQIGKLTLVNTGEFISPIAMALWTKHLKWTSERVKEFLVDVDKDLKDPKTYYYWIV